MNIQSGLERVSAVWWGFWGLLAALAIVGGLFGARDMGLVGIGLGGLVAVYVAHRLTCWIVAGFFAPRS